MTTKSMTISYDDYTYVNNFTWLNCQPIEQRERNEIFCFQLILPNETLGLEQLGVTTGFRTRVCQLKP